MRERNRHILFAPDGAAPAPDNFVIRSCREPHAGFGEVILESKFLSVDPYMLRAIFGHGRRRFEPNTPMTGRLIGQVIESSYPDFPEGCLVLTEGPWQSRSAFPITDLVTVTGTDDLELAGHLGALGRSGLTAWIGMQHLRPPRVGQKVVVSSAAGAVGGVAGQIAKMAGAMVIGITATPQKCEYVIDRLGFDDCFDYRASDFRDRLKSIDGSVDLFFDNVGGHTLDLMLEAMADGGSVLVCGQVSQYSSPYPHPIINFGQVLERRLGVVGFGVSQFEHLKAAGTAELARWHRAGRLIYDINFSNGLESAPKALFGLLSNAGVGKTVVKL